MKHTNKIASAILAVLVAVVLVIVNSSWALAEGTWSSKTPMPAARAWAAAGVINGILYVAGGHDGVTGGTPTLQAYNPATDTWSTLAAMPGRRYQGDGAGVINGELYVAGGWNWPDSGIPQNQLFVYSPGTNSWSSKASMPTLSGNGASGVINGKLYVTTAANGYSGYRNLLHVYDPATNTWSSLASSPNAHASPAFGVINNKLYVAGGRDDIGLHAKLDVYDPAANTWTTKAPMPTAGEGFAGAVINGKLYAIGGTSSGSSFTSVYVYDPASDTWTTETSMSTARAGAAAGVINGVIYVAGGSNSTGTLATVEALTPGSVATYTVTASAGANGSTSPAGAVVVNSGANQTFTITPNTGYHIADVLVDGSSVGAVSSYTFTNVTADHTIAASFAIINQPPFALFTYSPQSPVANQVVIFDASASYDSDGTIVSYGWEFGDGGIGTGVTAEHTYATANQYSVILTVTDNSGATDAEAKTITVAQTPPTAPQGRRSLPDPSTFIMVGSGLAVALFYIGLSGLRRRLNRD